MEATAKKTVLVVDADAKRPHGLAAKITERLGDKAAVVSVANFPEAYRWLSEAKEPPAVMLTDDTRTGSMSGMQFIDLVRKEMPALADTPIHFFEREQTAGPAPYPGVDGHYFNTPATPDLIVGNIVRAIAQGPVVKRTGREGHAGGPAH